MNGPTGPTVKTRALIASIPESDWDELRNLHAQITTTRGWTPLDGDARIAGDAYFDLVKHIHETYGITLWSMAIHLGLNGRTIKHWMKSHGYGDKPPSLKRYRGVLINQRAPRAVKLRIGGECKWGHLLTAETLVAYPNKRGGIQRQCRQCKKDRYQASKETKS